MTDKMDRRQARTKLLLRQALMESIREKGLDGVTVTDIASRANVNRGTFYLHYQDVPDMIDKLKQEVFDQVEKLIITVNLAELMEYAKRGQTYPKSVLVFEEVAKHGDFLRVMFGPKGDLSYAIQFREKMAQQIFNKLIFIQPDEQKLLVPRDYLVAYMSSANFGLVMHWLESGMALAPAELGRIMTMLISRGPFVSAGVYEP